MGAKNDEIISRLKLSLGEVFSEFEALEVEFEAFICPGNFGFLRGLGFGEVVAQQLENVDGSLKVLVGFLRRSRSSL